MYKCTGRFSDINFFDELFLFFCALHSVNLWPVRKRIFRFSQISFRLGEVRLLRVLSSLFASHLIAQPFSWLNIKMLRRLKDTTYFLPYLAWGKKNALISRIFVWWMCLNLATLLAQKQMLAVWPPSCPSTPVTCHIYDFVTTHLLSYSFCQAETAIKQVENRCSVMNLWVMHSSWRMA